jgi:hypothetical protein
MLSEENSRYCPFRGTVNFKKWQCQILCHGPQCGFGFQAVDPSRISQWKSHIVGDFKSDSKQLESAHQGNKYSGLCG